MTEDLIAVFVARLCYFGYLCVAGKFCNTYLETTKRKEMLFVIFSFSGIMLINIVYVSVHIPYIIFVLFRHLFFMGMVLLFFQSDTEKKILAASMLIITETLTIDFFASIFSCMELLWLHTVKNIAVPFSSERTDKFISCACFLITAFVVYMMSKHLKSVFYCKTKKWYLTLAIPLLAVTSVFDVASWGATKGIMVRSGGYMSLYYDQLFSFAEFCILDLLSMFAAGFYVFGMERISLEQKKSSQYHYQIAAYKMLEEQYSRSERLRHDLKNHILALIGLLENEAYEKMEDYLKNMAEHAPLDIGEEITGNRVVDVLLYQSRKKAEEKQILWECDVQMPKICPVNAFDLCVLFGNILDNALEACERLQCDMPHCSSQPFINIQAHAVKKCFLLEVKNSTQIADIHESGFTSKRNSAEHGIGLLNIRDVVHQYQGVMNAEVQNGIFTISVLVPLNNTVHDIKQIT